MINFDDDKLSFKASIGYTRKVNETSVMIITGLFTDQFELIEGSARKFVLYEVDSFDNI